MYPIHVLHLDSLTDYIKKIKDHEIVVYEFHRYVSAEFNTTSFEEFKKRSSRYYTNCISLETQVDDWPAKIDCAVKIRNEWYLCLEGASNFYLGSGPTSLIGLRQICSEKRIPILITNMSVMEFAHGRFPEYELPPYFNYSVDFQILLNDLKHKSGKIRHSSVKAIRNQSYPSITKLESAFKSINNTIGDAKIIMQKSKQKYIGKKEPELRDDLLDLLNMRLKVKGFGEVTRGGGRTDIAIPTSNSNICHIYECKVGISAAKFKEALEKLFKRYIGYHEKRCGIILFNRLANFSQRVNQISAFIKKTGGINLDIGKKGTEEFRCKYQRPSDKGDIIEVFVCAINLR